MRDERYPGPETIQRQILANGITLLAYENFASDSVVLEGVVGAGALLDPPGQAGLADFVADLLLRGASRRGYAQIYEDLEAVGANLGFGSGRHVTQFSGHGLADNFDLLLDILADGLRTPTFPQRQVEQVRGQILTGLQMRANDTQRMANLAFMETLYRGHPYGRSIHGYPDTVTRIRREDIVDFHRQNYGPRGMIIVVVGAIPAAQALDSVAAVLGEWENPLQPPPMIVDDVVRPQEIVYTAVNMPRKSQTDIVLGLPGPRRTVPDYLHASLMNTLLGVFGMMGRIGQAVREEQGLAYYAASRLAGGLGPGPWSAYAGVQPQNVARAIESIRGEIERMRHAPPPVTELADSQAYRTGSLPVGLETNHGLADVILDMELFGLGLDYLQRYAELINAITPQQVQTAAQKYLSAEQLVIAVAGPLNGDLQEVASFEARNA